MHFKKTGRVDPCDHHYPVLYNSAYIDSSTVPSAPVRDSHSAERSDEKRKARLLFSGLGVIPKL